MPFTKGLLGVQPYDTGITTLLKIQASWDILPPQNMPPVPDKEIPCHWEIWNREKPRPKLSCCKPPPTARSEVTHMKAKKELTMTCPVVS